MGKRRSRSQQLAGTPDSSKAGTPGATDSDASDHTPPRKKHKEDKKPSGPKSSEDLCKQFGLVHVSLQYTEADYQNLTNYGLFVRMVRPQVQEANPTISSSKMAQLMEAKWREFREGNPFTKKRREEEEKRRAEESKKKEDDGMSKKDKKKEEKKKQKQAEESRRRAKEHVVDSEPDEDELGDDDEDNDAAEDPETEVSEEEEVVRKSTKRRSTGLMRVRLPLPKSATKKKKAVVYESEEEAPKKSKSRRSRTPRVQESEEEVSEEEPSSRRSGRAVRKKKLPDYTEDLSEEDDSEPAPKKKKKKKQPASDEDFAGSVESISDEEPEDDDEDEDMEDEEEDSEEDERRRKKQKKKKKSKKDDKFTHVIPGERKSSRKSAGGASGSKGFLTDREFEKMIAHDAEYEKKKAKKKKKLAEIDKRKEANEKKKKAFFEKQERVKNGEKLDEDSGEESDHCFYCELCHDAGDLLLCDKCPRSWHQACLKLEKIPDGEWVCPKCTGEMESEEEDTGHETFCRVCKDGGDVILCDTCPCVFHLHCVTPALTEVPDGEWKCPRCETLEVPLKGWVHSILTWKWSHHVKGHDELDHTHSPTKKMTEKLQLEAAVEEEKEKEEPPKGKPIRMLFVRFRDYSYWECDWITELQLEMFHPTTWYNFRKKWDMDEPPALEDGSSFGKRRRHNSKSENDDPYNLEEKYYKWGVKPEWLQIDRIINHDKKKAYLVKWRELSYEEVTWEQASHVHPAVEGWQAKVDKYWARRKDHLKEDKRDKGPKPKKSLLKKKMDVQPPYIDDTGCKLHPYQLEGLNWLRFSWAQDTNTILADEMGLGKTIQAITFLYGLWKEGYTKGPFLLSVPLSTLLNWEREFSLWAPDMYVLTYIGTKEGRRVIREHEFSYKDGAFAYVHKPCRFKEGYRPKFDVLLTSYEFVSQDMATLNSIEWSVLVIDEAHRLKSQQSLFFRVLSQYKLGYILLLTGTPLQNNLEELFNLLNFLEREKFADMDSFLGSFTDISKEEQVAKLHEMLAPHMLRRLKIDVFKDLPSKTELIVRVELSALQKKYYKHILTRNYEALNVKGHSNQTSLMNIMMDLRKCCNHPYLFPAAETEAPITQQGYFEGTALTKACGKLEILNKMLRELHKQNHRVLIFSQMTRVLDILEDFMMHMKFSYERIDGSVMGKLRQESIDRFNSPNSDSFVFLLSTKAGGLGINLATADTVIIYDMDWNPHNDIQAFSRAHRIGQKNKVMIYRFVCRNTVEERMTQVCKQKMMLTELVIHRGMTNIQKKDKNESISKQEVNDILKFGAEKLFRDEEEGKVVYDDETIKKLLDRNQEQDNKKEKDDDEPSFGMNDYLRSFKVATYNVKDVAEEEEEEEEEKEEVVEEPAKEEDAEYWQRVLGSAYEEHQMQLFREQEELAASLGKGKRVRRKVNYAEALQEQKKLAKEERIRQKELREREQSEVLDEDEDDREDVLYMSDYEPASSEHSEESSDNQEEGVDEPPLEQISRKKLLRMSKQERYKIRMQQKEQKEREIAKPAEKEKMPPLLAKVNGQIEVLGFTPRQRRAFMDAIMRYGLPLEEVYKSQWLVRDLRRKPEKVFKAYVSLFLRHLCEPINEDSEKFADGTPREGLSRQHVLTRIGMMSLIRRKVNEFEKNNGTDSFQDFGIQIVIGGSKAELAVPNKGDKNGEKDKESDKEKSVEKESAENDKEKSEKEKSPESEKSEKEKSSEEEKKDSEEKEKEDKESKDEEKDKEEEKEKEGEKSEAKEGEEEKKEEGKSAEKDQETGEVEKKEEDKEKEEEKAEEKGEEKKESKDEEKDSEEKKDGEEKKESKEEAMEVDSEKKESGKDADSKADKEKDADSKPDKEKDADSKDESEKDKEGESKESQDKDEKAEKKEEKSEEKEKKEESKKDEKPKENGEKKDDGAKEKKSDKDDDVMVVSESKKVKSSVDRAIEERVSRQRRLRKKFYIADGGFTDLQNLWNYEENLIKDQKEYEVWHRHHDFWLLTGIVTHGYRHWQDILNDPRFEVLNRAFRNDSDKMRKGAFLNRRFQLLEQALVIEEQLRRELRENKSLLKLLPTAKASDDDTFTPIDQLAEVLRKLIKDGHIPAGTDPVLIKILMQIENLVGDIRQATYTGMPSTIAKSPAQLAARMQNISSPNPNTYPRGTVAAQLQQQQAAYQRQQQQQKARIISKPMTPMAPLQKKKGGVITID